MYMDIFFNTINALFSNYYNLIQKRMCAGLSPMQKKVALVALAYFCCATLGYWVYHYRLRVTKQAPISDVAKNKISKRFKEQFPPQVKEIQDNVEKIHDNPPKLLQLTQEIHSHTELISEQENEIFTSEYEVSEASNEAETSSIQSEESEEETDFSLLLDDSEDSEVDDSPTPILKAKKDEGIVEIDGKRISERTINCLKKLEATLQSLGKTYGNAIDNGDCFFDAFAKSLALVLNLQVTIKELRQIVSDYVNQLDQGPEEKNWIKKMNGKEYAEIDAYEIYKKRLDYTFEEALQKKWHLPSWANQRREGVILCRHYKVNLKIYEVGCLDDHPSKMKDVNNFWTSDPEIFPKNETYEHTIEMGLYPGHFLPVFDK